MNEGACPMLWLSMPPQTLRPPSGSQCPGRLGFLPAQRKLQINCDLIEQKFKNNMFVHLRW